MGDVISDALNVLGSPVKDRVTRFTGVATSVCFDLYGCVQVAITPQVALHEAEQRLNDGRWFDIARLEETGPKVMPVPAFVYPDKGPAEKPAPKG